MRKAEKINQLKVISFAHHNLSLELVGFLVIPPENRYRILDKAKAILEIDELLYIATCNRVEFIIHSENLQKITSKKLASIVFPDLAEIVLAALDAGKVEYEGKNAAIHFMSLACSLKSMVVGEKEISGQVRSAYKECRDFGLTGEYIKILVDKALSTAKLVFAETAIAESPVSVASIACRKLQSLLNIENPSFLIIGAGKTIQSVANHLAKHNFGDFTLYNRHPEKAQSIASTLKCEVLALDQLEKHTKPFNILITATSSVTPIVTEKLFRKISQGSKTTKVILDLGLPGNVVGSLKKKSNTVFIGIQELQKEAMINRTKRIGQIKMAQALIESKLDNLVNTMKEREIELALQQVPIQIKELRPKIFKNIFSSELNQVDDDTVELIDKILQYMEKKCIALPMKTAKEVMLKY